MLNRMLDGGFPEGRSVLLVGEPGTGKSTLGMQFLQEGLENGEDCLFISTEQTVEELRASFEPFGFDLDHERLEVTSIHATPGETLESEERELVLETFEDGEPLTDAFNAPFESRYVMEFLEDHAPCDRVVFDSASGLRVISESDSVFRRTVLDLVRLFNDDMEATAVFTGEDSDGDSPLRFITHGAVSLWRESVGNDPHTYLRVDKMRGVDHDRRRVEVIFGDDGIRLAPKRRSQPPELKRHEHMPVGVKGLDRLCGGGIVRGAPILLQHDGRANLSSILGSFLSTAFDQDYTVSLIPTTHITPERVDSVLEDRSVEGLLEDGRLSVLDMTGSWKGKENTRDATGEISGVKSFLDQGFEGEKKFTIVNASATVHRVGASGARELQYHQALQMDGRDVSVNVHNPGVTDTRVGEFFVDAAEQVIETKMSDDGLQYISLSKSPCGFVGTKSLVDFKKEKPYFRVQEPPEERENPMSVD